MLEAFSRRVNVLPSFFTHQNPNVDFSLCCHMITSGDKLHTCAICSIIPKETISGRLNIHTKIKSVTLSYNAYHFPMHFWWHLLIGCPWVITYTKLRRVYGIISVIYTLSLQILNKTKKISDNCHFWQSQTVGLLDGRIYIFNINRYYLIVY